MKQTTTLDRWNKIAERYRTNETVRGGSKKQYRKYLKSDHWQNIRLIALEVAGYKCERCENTNHLQVHHKTYSSGWYNEKIEDLEVLCGHCHCKEHDIPIKPKKVIMDWDGDTSTD